MRAMKRVAACGFSSTEPRLHELRHRDRGLRDVPRRGIHGSCAVDAATPTGDVSAVTGNAQGVGGSGRDAGEIVQSDAKNVGGAPWFATRW